mmetsp:Transcript_3911/g.11358  ORF Transcript_3911/g.11358 Transcript_3911/m.11358 type:complete len:207 (+) Transcript_3911:1227-1847(+)
MADECARMKFISGGSSASAALLKRSSKSSTTFWKLSRKIPLMLQSTSMRGRPSSSRGTSSKRAMRPVPSLRGRAPTSCSTMATDSPFVLMASKPQRFTDTVCGRTPLFAALWDSRMDSATATPRCRAAAPGILYGSRAWMFRPVGSTPAPSRSRSPPASGRMYSPFSARSTECTSSVFWSSSPAMSMASLTLSSGGTSMCALLSCW